MTVSTSCNTTSNKNHVDDKPVSFIQGTQNTNVIVNLAVSYTITKQNDNCIADRPEHQLALSYHR